MLYLVFDLDQTLYQQQPFSYHTLKRNPYLNFLLEMLTYKKLIFTNATIQHAKVCLDIIGIAKHFTTTVGRDTIKDLKPFKSAYEKFIALNNIQPTDYVFFFEDMLENLQMAKTFGWITFYIGEDNMNHLPYVNMSFKTIENTLEYFIERKK